MWREIRNVVGLPLAAMALAAACSLVPLDARAGIITELRTNPELYQTNNPFVRNALFTAQGSSSGASSSTDDCDETGPWVPGQGHGPGKPLFAVSDEEYDQIDRGLITEEEALYGCGASVASGRAGWIPLALVGLFLALRRRR